MNYDDIPKVMVDAVLAIEDRRFFEHSGVNFVRMLARGRDLGRLLRISGTNRADRRSPCSFRAASF